MQTVSVPYTIDDEEEAILIGWRRQASIIVRSAYKAAASWDKQAGTADFADERQVRNALKTRHPCSPGNAGIDAWIVHCAIREGFALRRARPDGRMVFGTKAMLERRRKGLVDAEAWKAARMRPLTSIGDKTFRGNRHVRLAPDARTAKVSIYGRPITLRLPQMDGKWRALLLAVARLAAAGEISVTFRVGRRLEVSFEELDLRRLPEGLSLQAAKDADLVAAGRGARGRPRSGRYVPPVPVWSAEQPRPVHPEWREPVAVVKGRCVGIDLNPAWIGATTVANPDDLRSVADTVVLDHALVDFAMPKTTSDEVVRECLAKVCNVAISQARAYGAGVIAIEDGLGKLRSGGRNRSLNRLINHWCRSVFTAMLTRRARLAGIRVVDVYAGYSTTIGNLVFPLPDACAAAGEIARRGLLVASGVRQGLLPAYPPTVVADLWKDRGLPEGEAILLNAETWGGAHRGLKAAKLGVRRPHPVPMEPDPDAQGPFAKTASGHAVRRLGHRRRPGRVYRRLCVLDGETTSAGVQS